MIKYEVDLKDGSKLQFFADYKIACDSWRIFLQKYKDNKRTPYTIELNITKIEKPLSGGFHNPFALEVQAGSVLSEVLEPILQALDSGINK